MDTQIYPDADQMRDLVMTLRARAERAEAEAQELRALLTEANRVCKQLLDLWMAAEKAKGSNP